VLLALVSLTGCSQPIDDDVVDPATVGPARDLAEPAKPLDGTDPIETTATSSLPRVTTTRSTASTTVAGAGTTASTVEAAPTTTTAPPRRVAAVTDRAADAGSGVATYGDAATVTVDDAGDRIVVTVAMHGDIPSPVPAGEVMGVGFDVFRSEERESDYQLFADGGADGWFAYLQTPTGFVEYPGDFGVGGSRLVFSVPWSALGGRAPARFSVFVDWVKEGTVRNTVGSDLVPDSGMASFSP
jgi:hypothetical protein